MQIEDRWHTRDADGKRQRTDRYGQGMRWRARWYTPDGNRRNKSFPTRDAAETHLAKVRTDIAAGRYLPGRAGMPTVAEYGERWRAHQLHWRQTTAEQAEMRLRLQVYGAIGSLPMDRVTRTDIQEMIAGWTLAAGSQGTAYSYVASLFKSAVADGLIQSTPCVRIRLPAVEPKRVVPLTVAQVEAIAAAVPARYWSMVVMAAATGMRQGELRGLTWDRVTFTDDGGALLRVDRQLVRGRQPRWGPPKTAAGDRRIRVGKIPADALRVQQRRWPDGPAGLVWWTRLYTPCSKTALARVWQTGTDGMGLRDRSGWHELRHHHASLLIAAGLSPRAVADRLGHRDVTETLHTYAHLWDDDEDRAVSVVDDALAGLTGPREPPGIA